MKEMLTNEQISRIHPINREAVEFYLKLADDRLLDALNTKKELEQKTFILFAGYIASIAALINLSERINSQLIALSIAMLIIAAVALLINIKTMEYGVHGREPAIWLTNSRYLEKTENDDIGLLKAYALHDYDHHIKVSIKSNATKEFLLGSAINIGFLAIMPLAIFIFI